MVGGRRPDARGRVRAGERELGVSQLCDIYGEKLCWKNKDPGAAAPRPFVIPKRLPDTRPSQTSWRSRPSSRPRPDAIGDRRVPETTSSEVKASEIQRISDYVVAKIEEVNLARAEAGEPALYADRAATAREEERSRGDRSAQASRTGRPTGPNKL